MTKRLLCKTQKAFAGLLPPFPLCPMIFNKTSVRYAIGKTVGLNAPVIQIKQIQRTAAKLPNPEQK